MKNWDMLIIGAAIVLAAWTIYHAHLSNGNSPGIPAAFASALGYQGTTITTEN